MTVSRYNELLDDTIVYLQSMKDLSRSRIYVEENFIQSKDDFNSLQKNQDIVKENKTEYSVKPDKDCGKIVDLFGNVIFEREDWEYSKSIGELNDKIMGCLKCRLGNSRINFVFGVGNPQTEIVIVGEAPGADEDLKGEPFVGRAGQLLNKMLAAIGLEREEVYICNILKCRPPGNRNPLPDEIESCEPYLKAQLNLIKPKLILALGKFAAETLLQSRQPLNKFRGKIHFYNGIKTMVTFHPAALLRNPNWKRPAWEDMKQFKALKDVISSTNNGKK